MAQGYYNQSEVTALGDIAGGLKVERAAAMVTAASVEIFTVIGGRIVLRELVGEVVVEMAAEACAIHIDAECAVGGATAMCVDGLLDLTGQAVGVKILLPATAAVLMVISTGTSALSVTPRWIIPAGTINLHGSTAPSAGTIKWTLQYVPLDNGAYVEAA